MEDFHFLRPWWLVNIAALVIIAPLLWSQLGKRNGWHKVIASHLATPLLGAPDKARRGLPFAVFTTAWILLSISLAGPTWERLPVPAYKSERAAILVMDMSLNTRAADVTPDRLSRLRFKALDLVDEMQSTQIGLVAYAGDAFSISPLTRDHQNIRSMVPALAPEIMPVAGNYPLLGIQEAHRMLVDAGYSQGEIFWFGAGIRQDDYQEIRSFLRNKGHRLSILYAGDDDSTPIRLAGGDMLRDSLGRISMAQLNSSLFDRLSNEFDGRSVRLRADDSDIQYITEQRSLNRGALEPGEDEINIAYDQWLDRGPYVAWLLIPLALFAARRGVIVCILLLPLVGILQPVHAANHSAPSLSPFKNQQQRASDAYQAEDYLTAASLFRDPMMQGNAYYRAGDYAAAAESYSQAGDSPERWFNYANSLAQLGQLDAAINGYDQALQNRPDWPEALENKALVESLKEQQEAENEQNEDQGESSSEDENGQQSDNQEQDDQQSSTDGQSEPPADQPPESETSEDDDSGSPGEQEGEESAGDDESLQPEPGEQTEADERAQQQAIEAALSEENLSDEERAELEQLLRRVQSDPALLLRNRMRLEAERRQYGLPPRGTRQP